MIKKKNRGFSMVEIVISIAIFAILLIPIISALSTSIRNTTQAKELQYKNEYAQNLMEYAKEDTVENILKLKYFESIGSYDLVKSEAIGDESTAIPGKDPVPYEIYTIKGNVNLGSKHTKYSYVMEISNQYYAKKEAEDAAFRNPNNLSLGIVEDLDANKVALIDGTIANYDVAVSNAFLTKKIQVLKDNAPARYEQYIKQVEETNMFANDTVERKIIVSVEGSAATGYKVTCKLVYRDNSKVEVTPEKNMSAYLSDVEIEYTPYTKEFKEKLPNIYLMYNTCLYNGFFSPHDYIVFDTSGLTDDTQVNAFVVETAATYSDNIASVLKNGAETEADKAAIDDAILYNNNIKAGSGNRDEVEIHLCATAASNNLENLNVFHNFDYNKVQSQNKKNNKILFDNIGELESSKYKGLLVYSPGGDIIESVSAAIGGLEDAQQESRGLYQIKVWISEGDSVDTTKDPVITGTKGGDES